MTGYRRVNYYELCRLCTSSEGTKMHIFREEGRRRQLPSKIQMCLPLQVSEDDSLPKIVCNQCVDKLDSMFEFRNSCVTAEAMLESYFTSLRYSEDFIREGKVYVKDESPKKKMQAEAEAAALKVPNVQTIASIPVSVDGLNNLVQAATIQIVNQGDTDLTRHPQFKCVEVPMSTSGADTSNVRFSYQTCTSGATQTTSTVTLLKADDHNYTDKPVSSQNHPTITQGPSYFLRLPTNVETGSGEQQEHGQVVEEEQMHSTMVFAPNHGQEVLVFDFNKDKDQNNEPTILRTDERASIAQIGEFLRMKTTVVVEDEEEHNTSAEPECVRCEQCGKELDSAEEQANHELTCPGAVEDKTGGGNFSCDVCGKLFKRKEHLFQHSKLHSGERPYSCAVCGKAFSRKEHLVRHSVSHTGQKSYSCDLCNKSFSRKDNLHKHRKTHGVAGPYVCETCGKSFVVKHYYLMHRTTHAPSDSPDSLPFRCDICYRGFSVKSHLISHKLRHRGRVSQGADGSTAEPAPQDPEEDPLAPSTVNASAILPPNVMHQGPTGAPLFHVSTGTNTTTYLTTEVINNYRRLHPS